MKKFVSVVILFFMTFGIVGAQSSAIITFLIGFISGPWVGMINTIHVLSTNEGLSLTLTGCPGAVAGIAETFGGIPNVVVKKMGPLAPPLIFAIIEENGWSQTQQLSEISYLAADPGGAIAWGWINPAGVESVSKNCSEWSVKRWYPQLEPVYYLPLLGIIAFLFLSFKNRKPISGLLKRA